MEITASSGLELSAIRVPYTPTVDLENAFTPKPVQFVIDDIKIRMEALLTIMQWLELPDIKEFLILTLVLGSSMMQDSIVFVLHVMFTFSNDTSALILNGSVMSAWQSLMSRPSNSQVDIPIADDGKPTKHITKKVN